MSLKSKLNWYINRLAAMSTGEKLHRVREALHKQQDRLRAPYRLKDYGPLPTLPGLKETLGSTALPNTLQAHWLECADNSKAGKFTLLGQEWPDCSSTDKWHIDPVTGTFWPKKAYCFSINYRHTDAKGDIKYVWELGRLQFLQEIAALSFKQYDEGLGRFALAEVENWIDHNPPHRGVHWSSGIELGLRVVSMLVVMTLCSKYITDIQRVKFWASLREHGWWLARYPSRFSSANNHMTAEGIGLFLLGALCTPLPEAKRWKKAGWGMLLDTAEKQILADGTGAEQTPNYTAVVLEMLLLGFHVARHSNMDIPEAFTQKLERGAEYLRWFMDAGGNSPRIGDDDNARVIGAYRREEQHVRSVLSCLAAVFQRPDLTPPGHAMHLRNFLFGSPPPAKPAPEGVHTFEQGGYTVGRHRVNEREVWLAVDHGYLGYLSIAAHGHADALSVWLHLDGKPVLVDSGTYLYHSGSTWRDYFRGTAAHNTLTLEGSDSSVMSGHFNWSHKANATRTALETGPDHWQIDTFQDGYRQRFGVIHRRRVSLAPARGLVIEDSLQDDKPHAVAINFHLHHELTATQQGNEIIIQRDGKPVMTLRHLSPLKPAIYEPGKEGCGWYSPTFSIKQPITRISFEGILSPAAKAITDFTFHWTQ